MDYIEFTFNVSPIEPGRDILVSELSELGFESFLEAENGLVAYIPINLFTDDSIQQIENLKNKHYQFEYQHKTIKAQNWNEEWEKYFDPVIIEDQCIVYASFHKLDKEYKHKILIDPKMSFGTGHHATTSGMIRHMLNINFENKVVLDMGSGTAVLAIFAAFLGAKKITAIDIDEWAFQNAIENVKTNQVEEKIHILLGDINAIEKNKTFDIVLANINRNVIMEDLKKYTDSTNPNGIILLSGFINEDESIIIKHAQDLSLKVLDSSQKDNWSVITLQKN